MGFRSLAAFGIAMLVMPVVADPALAQQCAPKIVRARGGPALIETTARSRARSAWIKKVRASRKLGRDYAAWLRASGQTYQCRRAGKRVWCEAAASPCRLEQPTAPTKPL